MRCSTRVASIGVVVSCVLSITGRVALAQEYTIIDLGTLGGYSSVALGVNDLGQVCGSADTAQGQRHAYLWDAGVMIDLGTLPPHPQSEAWDLSDAGHVVGISTVSGDITRGFLWQNGEMIDLGHLGFPNTAALGVNDTGQVAGFSYVSSNVRHAFLWEDGVLSDISGVEAWDINAAEQIVGTDGHAVLWDDGVMIDLGTLGGELSRAYGVNDVGQVVGYSERAPGGDRIFHAFLWQEGKMIDLGAIGGFESSRADAVNNSGMVIGAPWFLYDPVNGMQNLHDLIPPGSGWSNLVPRDINDLGQIVGSGGFNGWPRAFLMTPIDADFDDDGDVDVGDFHCLQTCLTGPAAPVDPECQICDINRDSHVDLDDYRAFQWVLTGP